MSYGFFYIELSMDSFLLKILFFYGFLGVCCDYVCDENFG